MTKLLSIIKSILLFLVLLFTIKYISIYSFEGPSCFIYVALLFIFIILNIKDYIKKNKIQYDNKYNLISIISLLMMLFILLRTLYDTNFIYNSSNVKLLTGIENIEESLKYYNILYFYQNLWWFILLFGLLFLYRKINMDKYESKYHIVSVICLFISIYSVIPSLQCLYSTIDKALIYLLFTIVLISVEIYRLKKDNHKKREWIIYLSFLFNLFALISIFVNLVI